MRPTRDCELGEGQNNLNESECILEEIDLFKIAPHKATEVYSILTHDENIIKSAQKGDYFRFMKNIGGGGGHELIVNDFKVTSHIVLKTTLKC